MFLSQAHNIYGATRSVIVDESANYMKLWLCGSGGCRMMHGKASRILKNRFFLSKAIELVEKNINLMEKKIKKKSSYVEFE